MAHSPEKKLHVTVWNEFRHERFPEEPAAKIYPKGIHRAISEYLKAQAGLTISTATLDEPEQGLSEAVLAETDVLIWWGHCAHEEVSDGVVDRVQQRVLEGMGLIVLHSGHYSKIFKRLMGTSCRLKWREAGEKERLWVIDPAHPIAQGLPECFELPRTEMYGEPFEVPPPEELVFISWFQGGEVFRSGCCWHRGRGKIFYFRPGHEDYPIYYDPNVLKVIENAVRWASPGISFAPNFDCAEPREKL
jgi:trehalose utilization protein